MLQHTLLQLRQSRGGKSSRCPPNVTGLKSVSGGCQQRVVATCKPGLRRLDKGRCGHHASIAEELAPCSRGRRSVRQRIPSIHPHGRHVVGARLSPACPRSPTHRLRCWCRQERKWVLWAWRSSTHRPMQSKSRMSGWAPASCHLRPGAWVGVGWGGRVVRAEVCDAKSCSGDKLEGAELPPHPHPSHHPLPIRPPLPLLTCQHCWCTPAL